MNPGEHPQPHLERYRARFDECGPDGRLRTSGLMRWAQDCAWLHSERMGFGRDWYAARGMWWLVRCADLRVTGSVELGETAAVTTTVAGFRRVLVRRRTTIAGAADRPVATVLTDWVLTGPSGAPMRVPAEFAEVFGRADPFEPARVRLEPTPSGTPPVRFTVRDHEIDPLAHANNAVYVDWLEEAVRSLGGDRLGHVRLEYAAPAARGAEVISRAWRRGNGVGFRLTDSAGVELLRAVASTAEEAGPGG